MSDRTTIATNAFLKGLLTDAVVDREAICVDMDLCTTPGVYAVTSNTRNIPAGAYNYGTLIVFSFGKGNTYGVVQVYITDGARPIYVRTIWSTTVRSWRRIPIEAVE